MLRADRFAGLFISAEDSELWRHTQMLLQNEAVLEVLGEGVAILQPDARILWANSTFEVWCKGATVGRTFCEALGMPTMLGPDLDPLASVLQGACVQTR